MSFGDRAFQRLMHAAFAQEAHAFRAALREPEVAQTKVLARILDQFSETEFGQRNGLRFVRDYASFCGRLPVTDYSDWEPWIERQRLSGRAVLAPCVQRYEPTSGSTGKRKWVPYTRPFLAELNRAAQAWIHELQTRHPATLGGRHFWSLSWVPTELRGKIDTDDRQLFPGFHRFFLNRLVVGHPAMKEAASSDAAWWASLAVLGAARDLSLISVWSPTYLLSALRDLFDNREELRNSLREARWTRHARDLEKFRVPSREDFPAEAPDLETFLRALWPRLALVSAWDSALSAQYARALKRLLPSQVAFQGKGLWATEGAITIPWADRYPLAVRSHFLEFRCLSSGSIYPSWRLETGQEVQPLLTTGSGLLRYALPDRVRVSGRVERTPTLEFLGRLGGVDLTGEKLSFKKASEVLAKLQGLFPRFELSCLGVDPALPLPRYTVFGVGEVGDELSRKALAEALERELRGVHHYAASRELGQLGEADARVFENLGVLRSALGTVRVPGQEKPNSIVLLRS
jgi:hypothetical protein